MKRKILCAMMALLAVGMVSAKSTAPRVLKMATTTSTDNSGLLKFLLPPFEAKYDVSVQVIAVGTGKALKLAENGDVDVVMVHAPEAEEEFVKAGFGVNRRPFMKNDFILVGPAEDPAGIGKAGSLRDALERLVKSDAAFISRGDESGTHIKEKELWKKYALTMPAARYLAIGQGMEAALQMADEKRAYTLSDRGTYLAFKDKLKLTIVSQGDPGLDNPYALIATNPARYPSANYLDAMLLIAWLTSPEGQQKIADFKIAGQGPFFPTAIPAKK
jgi:tungstate transport system substrate-binding protein